MIGITHIAHTLHRPLHIAPRPVSQHWRGDHKWPQVVTIRDQRCPEVPTGDLRLPLVTTGVMHTKVTTGDLSCPAPCVQCPPLSIFTPELPCDEPVSEVNKDRQHRVSHYASSARQLAAAECPCEEKCEMLWSGARRGGHMSAAVSSVPRCSLMVSFSFLHPSGRSANTY